MGVLNLEKAPAGLHEPWLGFWRASLRQMKDTGCWTPALRPLLDEYVAALRVAAVFRAAALERSFTDIDSGRTFLHPGFAAADREARRALMLAEALCLPPKLRAEHAEQASADRFTQIDELASRRVAGARTERTIA